MILRLFLLIVQISIKASIIVLLVMALKWTLGRKLSAGWHYIMWHLVGLILILPMIPTINIDMFQLVNLLPDIDILSYSYDQLNYMDAVDIQDRGNELTKVSHELMQNQMVLQNPLKETKQYQSGLLFLRIIKTLSIIWVCGLVFHICSRFIVAISFSYQLKGQLIVMSNKMLNQVNDCAAQIGLKHVPIAYSTRLVSLPAVFGIFRPKLLIPVGFEAMLSSEEMKLILLHELLHIKSKDILVNIVLVLLQSLHWFNPLLMMAFRQIHFDREMACDEMVLKLGEKNMPYQYGSLLIKLIEYGNNKIPVCVTSMSVHKSFTKRRIYMITQFSKKRKYSKYIAMIAIVVSMFFTVSFAFSSNTESLDNKTTESISISISNDISNLVIHPGQIKVDDINLSFVDDPEVLGTWESVDFVDTIDSFNPDSLWWSGDLYMTQLVFLEKGEIKVNDDRFKPWKWTKDIVTHSGDNTASRYIIEEIDGSTYMFFEWKSGDYTMRGMTPFYYVLKKVE